MLAVEKINVSYGDLQALWEASFILGEGEIVALIGPNGAGKTTILKTICGLLRPSSGSIRFEETVVTKMPMHSIVELGVSMVPEGRGLFPEMTVLENLELGAFAARGRSEMKETFDLVYGLFPVLKERKRQTAGTLSGGEQQMVAIARGLMSKPRLLLLDEPSWGLSPLLSHSIFHAIEEINRAGVTILLVEQNVRKALELANRAYVVENGRIVSGGDARQMLSDVHMKEAYLGKDSTKRN